MRLVLVPGVLALLPAYASVVDPVADLRAACLEAVAWLVEDGEPVTVLGDPQGVRVGTDLLDRVGGSRGAGGHVLVVGNGSARRSDTGPGQLDVRAHAFDEALGAMLRAGDGAALSDLDRDLAGALLAAVDGIVALGARRPAWGPAEVDYDADPFGVQYWVMRWSPT